MRLTGALNHYKQFDVTPVLGTEFVDINLADLMKAPNSDELIRELAIIGKPTVATTFIKQPYYSGMTAKDSWSFVHGI